MIRILATTAALAFVTIPALAQPTHLRPTRDVTVTYRMTGVPGVPPQETQMAFSTSTGKQRVDPPGGVGWMLIDRQANSAVMVMDAQRATMAMPSATVAAMTQDVPTGASFTRKGTATIAENTCTDWEVTSGQMHGASCITEDGVLLRAVSAGPNGSAVTMEATKVAYSPVDPARMTLPSGYTAMQMPGAPPGPAGQPAR